MSGGYVVYGAQGSGSVAVEAALTLMGQPYSVVEAMACGTPVIANDRGSMAELITHGQNGFLVDGIDSAVAAVAAAGELDRAAIADTAAARFTVGAMVDKYVAVYRDVLGARR